MRHEAGTHKKINSSQWECCNNPWRGPWHDPWGTRGAAHAATHEHAHGIGIRKAVWYKRYEGKAQIIRKNRRSESGIIMINGTVHGTPVARSMPQHMKCH